jgi:hypothetical protein
MSRRDNKRLISLTPEEDARLVAAAGIANRPVARVIRELALEGLDARAERMLPHENGKDHS